MFIFLLIGVMSGFCGKVQKEESKPCCSCFW